jgi:uncharacterized membrane protein YraQ (UPF0718 family)
MGLRTNFGDIAFEIVLPVTLEQPVVERVFRSSVNWAYTNLQGMTFGLLFAAAILTILANIRRRQFKTPWLNSVTGVLIGAPLGVCVNCATPIAFGIYSAGARLETALASLFASPTLNVIVLTMAFTLLPWEIAAAKTLGVVLLITCIPFLVRRFAGAPDLQAANAVAADSSPRLPALEEQEPAPPDEGFTRAGLEAGKQFGKNLWFLTRFALPLMILAGVLGALVIELVPFETFSGGVAGIGAIIAGGLVATFLPVPIAFDVIIVMALLANGVDVGLATALLFALGIYSIYPAAMIARYISAKLSIAVGLGVLVIAVALGLSTQAWFGQKLQAESESITAGIAESSEALYAEAVGVCDELPTHLRAGCFAQHIDTFDNVVSQDSLCERRPNGFERADCDAIVNRYEQTRIAIAEFSTEPCLSLEIDSDRGRCIYSVILRTAQRDHDVGRCDVLPDRREISQCRAAYLNASLLFNPDDTACSGLAGVEFANCKVNAAIYRHADTLNIGACEDLLPETARDHCRYTIASTMIGRYGDASGCAAIREAALAARCESLPLAWQAANEGDFGLCEELGAEDLRDTCFLRVADRKIDSVLARSLFSAGPMPDSLARLPEFVPGTGSAPELEWSRSALRGGIEISYTPYTDSGRTTGRFTRQSAAELGITDSWQFSITDFFEPFIIGKGIASGDFNNDQWPDLVLATERGVRIYRNVGGRFAPSAANQGELLDANVFLVALVDANGDGLQDIFASAYGGVNYLLLNVGGGFEQAVLRRLDGDHRLTLSAGFGDLDLNGELDIVLGNWSSGLEKLFAPEQSANVVMMQNGGEFSSRTLDEVKGETNSVLIADINNDRNPDLLIGNDRLVPDIYYTGDGTGGLAPVTVAGGSIPVTSMFTMSLDAADFNNDLVTDLFSTDMTFARSSRDNYCGGVDEQARCDELLRVYQTLRDQGPDSCDALANTADRQACFTAFSIKAAKDLRDARFCDNLPDKSGAPYALCEYLARPAMTEEPIDQSRYLAQAQRNTLLFGNGAGFDERAEAFDVDSSFWSWNAKAADLDNDGWQDIFVGNGFHFGENFYEIQENILFRNVNGARFEEVQSQWGLDDTVNTPSYTYVDIDLDGDLDIVSTGVLAAPRVFMNELSTGNSVTIALADERGNRFGIGASVTIRYGEKSNLQQRKEIKLSGGFLSFDNPVLHFGLGEHETIDEMTIHWPAGEDTRIEGPIPAKGLYRINRRVL